jgi:ribosomal-protein-alanine N-acetyltransferase
MKDPLQKILTERLILRQWRPSDFEPFARFHADPEHSRYIGGPMSRPMSWRYFAGVIGHWALRGFGFWAVEEKDSKRLIGGVGLWYPDGWPELELAYWLVPESQGKGLATEAGLKSLEIAFDVMRVETLVSFIRPNNEPSIRVAERLGGVSEGTIEFLERGPHSVYRYSQVS